MFNKQRWRAKSAEKVANEIEQIIKGYGVEEINFIDDNFFTHRKRAEEMLDLILERKLKFTWRTNCRANYFDNFDESFLRRAYAAGLREVQIGCESGSQKILDYMKKDRAVTGRCQIVPGNTFVLDYNGDVLPCTHFSGFSFFNILDVVIVDDLSHLFY